MFNYQYDEAALIRELNLTDFSPEEQASIISRVNSLLQERVSIRLQVELNEADMEAFTKLPNADEGRAFLEAKIPNINTIYDEEFAGIIEQLKGGLAAAA